MRQSMIGLGIKVLIVILVSCESRKPETSAVRDPDIVLVNARKNDRLSLAKLFDRISSCKAKVVGVNLLLGDRNDSVDSTIASSIQTIHNVVFVSFYQNDKYFGSDSLFQKSGVGEGLLELGVDGDQVTKQMVFISIGDELRWSFPMMVAGYFDPDVALATMQRGSNDYYEITYGNNDFSTLDINDPSWSCNEVADKILLVGFLGPEQEDMFPIRGGEMRYSTWIIANCVRDILSGNLKESDRPLIHF